MKKTTLLILTVGISAMSLGISVGLIISNRCFVRNPELIRDTLRMGQMAERRGVSNYGVDRLAEALANGDNQAVDAIMHK